MESQPKPKPAAGPPKKTWYRKKLYLYAFIAVGILFLILLCLLAYIIFFYGEASPLEKDCLKAHNHFRKLHGVPDLKLNRKISKFAKEWAKENADSFNMHHRVGNKYGENIYATFVADEIGCDKAVNTWYGEIIDYDYDVGKYTAVAEHFTQVIWKGTKEMGCGSATDSKGGTWIVCNYEPSGNMPGKFPANVLPVQTPDDEEDEERSNRNRKLSDNVQLVKTPDNEEDEGERSNRDKIK